MTTRILALGLCATMALGGFATRVLAQAADTRCIADGGPALCTQPEIAPLDPDGFHDSQMWEYGLCDMRGPYLWRSRAWCEARGGSWGADGCIDARPVFDPDVVPVSRAFEVKVQNACQIRWLDTGWGQTIPDNILCWSGGPLYQNGQLTRDFRTLDFDGLAPSSTGCNAAWAETVHAGKWRKLVCPMGYNQRTKPNGDIECWKLPAECRNVGNPVNLLDGCKLQDEVDYQSRAPGGLALVRYYSSAGFFRFEPAPAQATDVWRTNWDRRVLVPAGSALMAYVQRPDGTVQAFLPSGAEMHNVVGGAAARLERVTSGPAAWKLTTAERDVEFYDTAGRLQSVTSRTGLTHMLAYDAGGRLTAVSDSFGATMTFVRDADGRLGGFVAPGNRAWSYGYDADGRLTTVTYPDGAVRRYHYEDPRWRHGLTGITDESGQRFASWTYDAAGRAIASQHGDGAEAVRLYFGNFDAATNNGGTTVVDGFGTHYVYSYKAIGGVLRVTQVSRPCPNCSGGSAAFTYDANGNVASYRDFNGNQTTYTHDPARNLEISRTEGSGTAIARTIATQWHPYFRLPTRITAPSGVPGVSEITDFVYDTQGNLLQKSVTAGSRVRRWAYTYNAFGQPLTADGPRTDVGDVTAFAYYGADDPCAGCRGNVRTITNALGHATTFDAYDADGRLTRVIDSNGVATSMSYDLRGRLTARVANPGDPAAEAVAFDYDSRGLLGKVTLADGSFIRYQYDAAHRLTEIADRLGNVVQYTLDAMGNRIKEEVYDPDDAIVRTRQRTYDALNRLYSEIGASDQLSVFAYDGNGNSRSVTDPLGRVTTRSYDSLNRQLTSIDPANGIVQYGYDAKDRLVSVKDPINLTTTYSYDGLGDLLQLNSPDTGATTFATDASGNVTASTDARGLGTSYAYDSLGRQTATTFAGGSVALEYDNTATGGAYARGRLTRMTDPSGSTSYSYDAWGRILAHTQTIGAGAGARTFTVTYKYASGRLVAMTYPSGRTMAYQHDAQGRVATLAFAGLPVVGSVRYQPFGAVEGWIWANGQVYRRSFDQDGRVAAVTLGPDTDAYPEETWDFGYDALDRLTSAMLPDAHALRYAYDANGNRKREIRDGSTTDYSYSAGSNRLQSMSGAVTRSFTYDGAGNTTGNGILALAYDGRGRLTGLNSGYSYLINGLGQRVAKSGATGTSYYVYDEQGRLIGEYDAAGALHEELIYLADTPVATIRPKAGGGTDLYFIYTDHLNSPRLIINQTNQKVWEWKLDAFGAGAPDENPSGVGAFTFNLRFPGQYFDGESGLHYNYFRDYDPTIGRYVESDPIGLDGGMNAFSYVASNPLRFLDAFGLEGCGSSFFDPIIPNNPFGFPFKTCCDTHDDCYDDCRNRQTKQQCDRTFCSCLSGRCAKYTGAVKWTCDKTAAQYCDKASNTNTSRSAFEYARKKCVGPIACVPANIGS
jgi:RHS repeat-associated protein